VISKIAAWVRVRAWWIVSAVFLAFSGLYFALLEARKPPADASPGDVAGALRPGMQKRADWAQSEALRREQEAHEAIMEGKRERDRVSRLPPADVLKESAEYAKRLRARRSRPGTLLALFAALSLSSVVHAQESLPEELSHPQTAEPGYWIPDDVWIGALADGKELEALQLAGVAFQAALDARNAEASELRQRIELERASADVLALKLQATSERLETAQKWYRSPRFLVPVGVLLGAALVSLPLGLAK
jgi:hypothetical protein